MAKIGFFSRTLHCRDKEGITKNGLAAADINWDAMMEVLADYYDDVDKPVHVTTSMNLKNFSGYQMSKRSNRTKKRSRTGSTKVFHGMDKDFVAKAEREDGYHRVRLGDKAVHRAYHTALHGHNPGAGWGLPELYKDDYLDNKTLCFVMHVMAHEMQHVVQSDKDPKGKPTYFVYKGLEKKDFPAYHQKNGYRELDAEQGARVNGPKLVKIYKLYLDHAAKNVGDIHIKEA
jgi:hypothetical protein